MSFASKMYTAANNACLNLKDLKSQLQNQVGAALTRQYFSYLNALLSKKLTKPEFDQLCILTLGQDNLFLHNQLIRSVFQNACHKRLGKPDRSLQPAPPISYNGSALPVTESAELDITDFKRLVKRQRVQENIIPVTVPVLLPHATPASKPIHPSMRKLRSSRSFCETDFLVSDEQLKRRLDDIAQENGLEGGATLECAQLLNSGLDLYLRRLIRSCFDLVHSRGGQINNMSDAAFSIQDFRVSMEMNPQQLGQDWPLLLERLSCLWFESKD